MATPHTADAASAQLIVHNAVLFSNGQLLEDTALAICDGKIVAIGGAELADLPAERGIDANGGLVTPGFVDAHIHAAFGGVETNRCDLSDCDSADEIFETIRAYADAHPDAEWILGGGYAMAHFDGGTPTAAALDAVVADRPVYLLNSDHHGSWVNSEALRRAGITADTPDPADGHVERDTGGNPTGALHEGASDLLVDVLPATTGEEIAAGLRADQDMLFGLGITGWQEAILGEYQGYPDITRLYAQMVADGQLTGRISGALWVSRGFDGKSIEAFVDELVTRREANEHDGIVLDSAKIMIDGIPENETAAMLEPYASPPQQGCACQKGVGLSYFTIEELKELVPLLNERGINAHMHAIGDRAVRYGLDAVDAVDPEVRAQRRNHIAHVQVVDPTDIDRFEKLGVVVNAQMRWACRDQQMTELTLPLLGEQRADYQYPFAALHDSGAKLAAGSDWPVSTPDPWQALHVAVNRAEPGAEDEPLIEDQALNLATALTAYTVGANEVTGVGSGLLAVGEVADLAIADRNPFESPAEVIHETRNQITILGGDVVFEQE